MGILMPTELTFSETNSYLEIITPKSMRPEEQVTDFLNEIKYSLIYHQFLLSTSLPDIDLGTENLGIDLGIDDIRINMYLN